MTCNSCVIRLLKELYDAYHEPVEDIKDEPSPNPNPDKDKKVTKVTKVTKQSGTKTPNKNNIKKLN